MKTMKNTARPQKIKIPLIALTIGLIIGLGIGHMQMKREQKVFQDKIKEANKKMAFMQKKASEEKNETIVSIQQQYQNDLDRLQNEKKALGGQLGKLKGQVQKLEMKTRESDEASAKDKKELQALERDKKNLDQELKKTTEEKHNLKAELKKTSGEKQNLQTELKKTIQNLDHCASNNAELSAIAEELVKKYRNKGLGTILMEKEPLTQIKKVKLEHLTQQYREGIEELKIKKNKAGGKNVTE